MGEWGKGWVQFVGSLSLILWGQSPLLVAWIVIYTEGIHGSAPVRFSVGIEGEVIGTWQHCQAISSQSRLRSYHGSCFSVRVYLWTSDSHQMVIGWDGI